MYKSDNVFGPYVPNPDNPVLTQFGMPDDREHPVTATGHADMFQDTNGDWWTVFLGTRVYDLDVPPQDPGNFQTGRETFMLPVTWKDGWPVVLEKGKAVPYAVEKPKLPAATPGKRPVTGNFVEREEFAAEALGPQWLFVRAPRSSWWKTGSGQLVMEARPDRIGDNNQPSFVGRRLAHMTATVETEMRFDPRTLNDEAGLMAIQNDEHYFAFGLGLNESKESVLRIRKRAGRQDDARGKLLMGKKVSLKPGDPIHLRMQIDKAELDFSFSLDGKTYELLVDDADSKVLTSAVAGGFTGAVIGMYAEGEQ